MQDDSVLKDFLIDSGLVGRSQLSSLPESEQSLAQALVSQGILGEDEVRKAVAQALGVPFVELGRRDIATEAMILIPEPFARTHNIFAYNQSDKGLEVVVLDLAALDHTGELKREHKILPRLTTRESMRQALVHYQKHLKEKFGELLKNGEHLAEALIKHALYSRAGGVHIDPQTTATLVRYQIDHTLHEAMKLPEQVGKQLVSQIKTFAKLLPVSRPQEGKFKMRGDSGDVNVRVHSLPTVKGEKMYVRLAHENLKGFTLESLGFHGEALESLERAMARHQGLIVVRGAGKTTLLHTLADLLESPHKTVVWVRDAVGLRAALKQDPDVVVVDDVKDTQTAVLARAAAQRGTFVIAAEAGGETSFGEVSPPELTITLAKVRRLCTKQFAHTAKFGRHDAEALEPYADFVKILNALKEENIIKPDTSWKDTQFAHPTPCSECLPADGRGQGHSGYVGEIGLQQVEEGPYFAEATKGTVAGLNIIEDGLFKAGQGITSVEEVVGLLSV